MTSNSTIPDWSNRIPVTHSQFPTPHPTADRNAGRSDPDAPTRLRGIDRRGLLAIGAGALLAGRPAWAAAMPGVRLGILQFGTVQWIGDIIHRHGLDASNGFTLSTSMLANTDAGRVALMANAADIVVSDWMFVASQRAAGTKLCFAPFSSALGGVMVPQSSPVRSLADLAHRRLGVAGGPTDKSWLIVRAAAKAGFGFDPKEAADVVYGAPPLLSAKLTQGELDAALTFWNFAARLEAVDYRQVVSVSDCVQRLGVPPGLSLVGFVFREEWARQNEAAVNGFLTAATAADDLLAKSDDEWKQIRPLMNASDDAVFQRFRQRFVEGIPHASAEAQQPAAERLFEVLLRTGGTAATDGLTQLPPGIFWDPQPTHG